MTFVGKLLVVVQVILSICFMAFAGAVFTAQTNWKKKAETAATELDKSRSDYKTKEEKLRTDLAAMTTERDNEKTRADGFQAQTDNLQKEKAQLEKDKDTLTSENGVLRSQLQIASEEATQRLEEAKLQRAENKVIHDSRNALLEQVRNMEKQLFVADVTQKTMADKHNQALIRVAFLEEFLRRKGMDADPKEVAGKDAPPPIVEGLVLSTKKGDRDATDFIEISLGSDDGLLKGHDLFVYRTNGQAKFLGKIRIVYVTPDRAVGTVVEKAKNGVIQKGDNVTSKL